MRGLRRQRVSGTILLVLGLVLLVSELTGGLGGAMVLLLIGSAFIVGYLHCRSYGLLIPGSILLGLGSGLVGQRWLSGLAIWTRSVSGRDSWRSMSSTSCIVVEVTGGR